MHCPSRFSSSSTPALLTPSGDANHVLWYPDSGASAHMTPNEEQSFGGGSFFKQLATVIYILLPWPSHLF
ncbi:unnamed protein product [Cuscuta epithymum]|uniref:Uncharacterized protein n=1 Tax=Cuscuta epithymum TaxID=186058 RepID=A0AAV0GGD4_9ASTE|nr:unnamed protein product [Cuscuta epithymum]